MLLLLLTAVQVATGAPEFKITAIDGSFTTGRIIALRGDQLKLATSNPRADKTQSASPFEFGESSPSEGFDRLNAEAGYDGGKFADLAESNKITTTVPLEKILRIRQVSEESSQDVNRDASRKPSRFPFQVQLLDGTQMFATTLTSDGAVAQCTRGFDTSVSTTSVSMSHVHAIRFGRGNDELDKQWNEISQDEHSGDVLVIRKSTDSLDYLAGVVSGITPEHVKFRYEDQDIDVKHDKLYGILFYSKPQGEFEADSTSVKLQTGPNRYQISNVGISQGVVKWTTVCGASFSCDLKEVDLLDFGADKILYLSDAEPATLSVTPRFGSQLDEQLGRFLYAPRIDQSFSGTSLRLRYHKADRFESYAKGLALHSRTELQYRLNRKFSRLRGIVGLEPGSRAGNIRLIISGDGEALFNETVQAADEPRELDLDVSGRRRLTILVDYGDESDIADRLHMCELRIIK